MPTSMRMAIRTFVLKYDSPLVLWIQQRLRTPQMDFLNARVMTLLGTHNAFLISLPLCFWLLGNAQFSRQMTIQLGAGVILTNIAKDLFSLPRPPSPPIVRLLHDDSSYHVREFGFPSTHACNAASISLFIAYSFEFTSLNPMLLLLLAFYAVMLPFSRIYCGMHSIVDVLAGTLLGHCVTIMNILAVNRFGFDDWLTSIKPTVIDTNFLFGPSIQIPHLYIVIAATMAIVVGIMTFMHPNPRGACPCIDDSLCLGGVLIGLTAGTSRVAHYRDALTTHSHNVPWFLKYGPSVYSQERPDSLQDSIVRILLGVTVLVLWRLTAKKVIVNSLTRVWSRMKWPLQSVPVVSLILRSRREDKEDSSTDVVVVNTDQDEEESKSYNKNIILESEIGWNTVPIHDIPRHGLDIFTKLVVYSGIAWFAVDGIPTMFNLVA